MGMIPMGAGGQFDQLDQEPSQQMGQPQLDEQMQALGQAPGQMLLN